MTTLRLILGDQLHRSHSWCMKPDPEAVIVQCVEPAAAPEEAEAAEEAEPEVIGRKKEEEEDEDKQ